LPPRRNPFLSKDFRDDWFHLLLTTYVLRIEGMGRAS
jgi:hypothetical protein